MCGIVGILRLDGAPVDLRLLRHMADALNHRGPDDEGAFLDGPLGLYHKRLSIIDLTTGHQPMESDGFTIVFNGEIYNYLELREELGSKGHGFRRDWGTEWFTRALR